MTSIRKAKKKLKKALNEMYSDKEFQEQRKQIWSLVVQGYNYPLAYEIVTFDNDF